VIANFIEGCLMELLSSLAATLTVFLLRNLIITRAFLVVFGSELYSRLPPNQKNQKRKVILTYVGAGVRCDHKCLKMMSPCHGAPLFGPTTYHYLHQRSLTMLQDSSTKAKKHPEPQLRRAEAKLDSLSIPPSPSSLLLLSSVSTKRRKHG